MPVVLGQRTGILRAQHFCQRCNFKCNFNCMHVVMILYMPRCPHLPMPMQSGKGKVEESMQEMHALWTLLLRFGCLGTDASALRLGVRQACLLEGRAIVRSALVVYPIFFSAIKAHALHCIALHHPTLSE